MLKVFICEDNARQLLSLTNLVDFCIKSNAYNASIAMSTQFPDEIIAVMPQQNTTGLYFLDIDLGCDIDAYKLSAIIREHDSRAFIVIVTSDENAHATVLKHTVEPMDYIVKNSPDYEARIKTCIKVAYKRHIANSTVTGVEFSIKLAEDADAANEVLSRGMVLHLNSIDIVYIESLNTGTHHVNFHMRDKKVFLVRRTMKSVEEEFGNMLVRCHVSCLVNKSMIATVDTKERKLRLKNGEVFEIGRRHVKNFLLRGKEKK